MIETKNRFLKSKIEKKKKSEIEKFETSLFLFFFFNQ